MSKPLPERTQQAVARFIQQHDVIVLSEAIRLIATTSEEVSADQLRDAAARQAITFGKPVHFDT